MRWFEARPRLNNRQGDTLVEVIFALAILATLLTVLTVSAVSAWRNSRLAGERTQAAAYVQEQVEALRAYRRSVSWQGFVIDTGKAVQDTEFVMRDATAGGSGWQPSLAGGNTPIDYGIYELKIKVAEAKPSASAPTAIKYRVVARWKSLGVSSVLYNESDQLVEFTNADDTEGIN